MQKTTPQPRLGSLVGRWFHSFHSETKNVDWQGQIVANPTPTTYLVQLYSWLDGCATNQQFVNVADMNDWHLYDTDSEMRTIGVHLFRQAMQNS